MWPIFTPPPRYYRSCAERSAWAISLLTSKSGGKKTRINPEESHLGCLEESEKLGGVLKNNEEICKWVLPKQFFSHQLYIWIFFLPPGTHILAKIQSKWWWWQVGLWKKVILQSDWAIIFVSQILSKMICSHFLFCEKIENGSKTLFHSSRASCFLLQQHFAPVFFSFIWW